MVSVPDPNKPDIRKIQLTGGTTHIISLPKEWVQSKGLTRGSAVALVPGEQELCIRPLDSMEKAPLKKAVLRTAANEAPDTIIRRLVSTYLLGYNVIRIVSEENRLDADVRIALKGFVRKTLVGTEVLNDLPNEFTLQVLLKYSDLSVKDALRRMSVMVASMHRDAILSLSTPDEGVAKEIIGMDDDVDRFSLYVIRLLKASVIDAVVMRAGGISSPRECLGYRLIAKSLERTADHAVNIAENRLTLAKAPVNPSIVERLADLSESALGVLESSMNALFDRNYKEADRVFDRVNEIRGRVPQLVSDVARLAHPKDVPQLRLIIGSILRIAEYGDDIAEIVLNMTVQETITEEVL